MSSLPGLYLLFALMGYNFLTAMGAMGFRQVRKGIFQLKHLSDLRAFLVNFAVKPNNYVVPAGTLFTLCFNGI